MRRTETCAEFSRSIERFLDTPVKRYPSTEFTLSAVEVLSAGSSGMVVRLAFAVAAHPSTGSGRRLEPETCPEQPRRILLVDESLP